SASDCRTWPHELAESVGVQLACLSGSRYWPVETGHRSCAALANRQASSNRSGTCCRRPQPHAGVGTPELRPHCMRPRGPGIIASSRLIHATRSRAAAGVDLVIVSEIGESFEDVEQVVVPEAAQDVHVAGAALRTER